MVTKVGLDLGYANITLSDVTAGISREPSVVLIDDKTSRVLALGNAALESGEGETPAGILVRPFKNGLIYSRELTGAIIANAVRAIRPADKIRCVIGLPADCVPRQEKELYDIMAAAGIAECFGVRRSLAALIGSGYAPTISAISVNIGAGATEIAVLHKGTILFSSTEHIGGEDFDRAVKDYILTQGDVNISISVARAIKEKIGAVWEGRGEESIDIRGTLSLTGNRVNMNVTTEDILGVFEKPLHTLILAIADSVKKIPIDCGDDIFKNGMILSGGGANLFGLDKMISHVLDIPVTMPQEPLDSVARGLSRINTFLPERSRNSHRDVTASLAKYYEAKKEARAADKKTNRGEAK